MANLATQAHTALTLNRDAANRLTKAKGVSATQSLLQDAADDLEARLAQATALGGPGEDSFTAARLRATLAQVQDVTKTVARGLQPIILGNAGDAAEAAANHTLEYLSKADQAFRGVGTTPLALREASAVDRATQGVHASVLRRLVQTPDAFVSPVKMGIIQRYGIETVGHFQDILQKGLLTGKSLQEMRSEIIEKSPFLQGAPLHWATRIVRTECLLGDTLVTGAVVRAAFRRWYEGTVYEIVTESGREFTATPNHPMLTRRGWIGAGSLNERDYLICDARKQNSSSSCDEYVTGRPATIRQIFDSISTVGIGERRTGRKPDFHGDGCNGEINVARIDRSLNVGVFSPLDQPLLEDFLSPSDFLDAAFCHQCARLLSTRGRLCICVRTQNNPRFSQASLNAAVTNSVLFRELGSTSPFEIFCNEHVGRNILAKSRMFLQVVKDLARSPAQSSLSNGTSKNIFGNAGNCRSFFKSVPGEINIDGGCYSGGLVLGCDSFGVGSYDSGFSRDRVDLLSISQSENASDAIGRQSSFIELDRVKDIRVREFHGHVYNLETEDGYFDIEGVYTGNCAAAYGKAALETLNETNEELGDMVKILCATFDERTGADSYAQHGQIRRPEEPFESWFGPYMYPPNRPNDREIIVPHRISWEIPDYLTPLDDGEVEERWEQLGNKKEMPERPEMSTVDLDLFGEHEERTSSASQIDQSSESPETAINEDQITPELPPSELSEFADEGVEELPTEDQPLDDAFNTVTNEIDLPPEAIDEILQALANTGAEDEDMLSFLESYPLDNVTFEDLPNTEDSEYTPEPPQMTINAALEPTHDWVPGRSRSIVLSTTTPDDAVKAAGHRAMADHLRLSGPNSPVQAQIQTAIDESFANATPITKLAQTSPGEYFKESYAAYRLYPETLKEFDPNGYKLVLKVLSKRGITD